MKDFTFYYDDLRVAIPVVVGLIGFIIFWFTQKSAGLRQKMLNRHGNDKGWTRFISSTRILGGLTIGFLTLVVYLLVFPGTKLLDIGFGFIKETCLATLLWSLGLAVIIVPMTYFSAKKPANLTNYPQIRAKEWTRSMIFWNLFSWAFYLLGYELFFRGLLLFPLVAKIGLWPAIAINIGMYSATHVPKGLNETIGAIPLSVVLCLLSVSTGTIWIAFLVHVAMAWTNSLASLKFHPEMKIIK